MTVNLFQTGVSGLMAAQSQLGTTGHNLANVNTEGYSRQNTSQDTTIPQNVGGNYFGTGTYIVDTKRVFNQFTHREQLKTSTYFNYAEDLNRSLENLDSMMSYSSDGIKSSIVKLYESVNSIADTPNDIGLRKIALSHADALTDDFHALDQNLRSLEKSASEEFFQVADKITKLSEQIALLNKEIISASNQSNNGAPNDLLDQRDRLIGELATYTQVTTLEDSNSVMTVMIGLNGNTLVAGITPLELRVRPGDPDPQETQFELVGNNSVSLIQADNAGGKLQAMFEYRDEHLKGARAEIDQLAMGISSLLNSTQREGLNLQGLQGTNIFSDINGLTNQQQRVIGSPNNSGNLQAQVNISDMSLLPANEFQISYDGANYVMTNLADNSTAVLGAAGATTYATAYGFEFIEASGAPNAGDRFLIKPTEGGAAALNVTLQEPSGIAASTAVEVINSEDNISDGRVVINEVFDPVTARTVAPMRVEVLENPANTFTYTVFNDNTNAVITTGAYTPPTQTINLPPLPAAPAFSIDIEGTPSGVATNGPETFYLVDAFGEGNGDNALSMGLSQQQKYLNGNRDSFSQSLANTTADIGTAAAVIQNTAATSETLYEQAVARHQEISGVNLDEEAAKLLQFQQAYQAASRIITTANTIFDTLFSAIR